MPLLDSVWVKVMLSLADFVLRLPAFRSIMPIAIVRLAIWLAQHADADLDESAGLGLETQRCEFLHWAAGGAVRTGHDALRTYV